MRQAPLFIVLLFLAAGCGPSGHRVTNQPPHVEIVGSPVEGDSVNYVVDFFWHAWDDDGAITRSEYAVDIPSSFTPEQIADPTTPGIEWTSTPTSRVRLRFSVAAADSAATDSTTYLSDRASAPHTFFVRSYDNEDGHSSVAERSFNAWTVLPRTTITEPITGGPFGSSFVTTLGSLRVRWTAVDPDGPTADSPPLRTEYKLIRVASIVSITDANFVVNVDPGPRFPWVRVLGDSATVTLAIAPAAYVLALRSIDEAGGAESRFELGRNALLVQTARCPFNTHPVLTVRSPELGSNVFPFDGTIVDYQVFTNECFSWELSGDAQSFGGTIQAYRWCVDSAEDPLSGGDDPGCVPWGTLHRTSKICFSTPGIHTVAFGVRATSPACGDGATSGTLRLTVIPRYFDRDVLYVDDFIDPGTDAETDRRFLAALRGAGYQTIDSFDAWGSQDRDGAVTLPTLATLSRYRMVFWSVRGAGGGSENGNSALLQATSCYSNWTLRQYVAAGGAVWINGETVFGALKPREGSGICRATTSYSPNDGLNFSPGSFVTDFLHLAGGDIRQASGVLTSNGLLRARPTAAAQAEGFPTLEADSTMYPAALGGVGFYDAMFQPTFLLEGGLDTLYVATAARPNSAFNGKPIAWRYADLRPEPRQGPVVITSLPLQKMKEGAPSRLENGVTVPGTGLDGMVQVMAAWLRAHDATQTLAPPWERHAAAPPARYDTQARRN